MPLRIATRRGGGFVVSDPGTRTLHLVDARGLHQHTIPLGFKPYAVGEGPGDTLYVGDASAKRTVRIDSAGVVVQVLGEGENATERGVPNDLAVQEGTGDVWVVDTGLQAVRVYGADGSLRRIVGATGSPEEGRLERPSGITISRDGGEVYVLEGGAGRVVVFDGEGGFVRDLGALARTNGPLLRGEGIAVDSRGWLYVPDLIIGRVGVFDGGDGHFRGALASRGRFPGQLGLPSDVVTDPSGRMAVTSYRTRRVEIYALQDYDGELRSLPLRAVFSPNRRDPAGGSAEEPVQVLLDVAGSESAVVLSTVRVAGAFVLTAADATLPPQPLDAPITHAGHDYGARGYIRAHQLASVYGGPGAHQVPIKALLADGSLAEGWATWQVPQGGAAAGGGGASP